MTLTFWDFIVTTLASSGVFLLIAKTFAGEAIKTMFTKNIENHKAELGNITEELRYDFGRKTHDFTIMAAKKHEYYQKIHEKASNSMNTIGIMLHEKKWSMTFTDGSMFEHLSEEEVKVERIKILANAAEEVHEVARLIGLAELYSSNKVSLKLDDFAMGMIKLWDDMTLVAYAEAGYDNPLGEEVSTIPYSEIKNRYNKLSKDYVEIVLLMKEEMTISEFKDFKNYS